MDDLEFTVMPRRGEGKEESSAEDAALGLEPALEPQIPKGKRRKWLVVSCIAVLFLAILGFFGYKYVFRAEPAEPSGTSKAPEITVPEPTKDLTIDTDKDGLTDEQEILSATNSKKADTDGDGLADGDEVKIYLSDPLLPDTDGDGFEDGREVARGYSPVSTSSRKATPDEVQKWTERIAQFGLHQPTQATVKLISANPVDQQTLYANSVYGYSLSLPGVLAYREDQERRVVGFYVSGNLPDDPDLATDPISASIAVKVPNQTLRDWIDLQYPAAEYAVLEEVEIGDLDAIRLKGTKDESCFQDKTFIPRGSTIIVLTWTCVEHKAFGPYYEQIVQSFKFQ